MSSMSTLHITAKLKAGVSSGMRISGTLVAVNAAGISFPQYYGSPPQSAASANSTMQLSITDKMDIIAISANVGFSPLQAGHSEDLIAAPSSASAIWITTMGAVSSSTATDSLTAIRNAISAAQLTAHKTVFVPAGDYAYSNILTVSAVAIVGQGPTSILRATDWTNRGIWLKGSSAGAKNLKLLTNGVVDRQGGAWYAGIEALGAVNFICENIYIKPTGATGFGIVDSSGPGTITRCTISGTLADSIHMTNEAHHITVTLNKIRNSGDDGIACVSYRSDGGNVKNIEAAYNWIADNANWGRGMSVIGGNDINYHNNLIENVQPYAGILIAQEASFASFGCTSISLTYNTVINCGSLATGHSGIMLICDNERTNSSVDVVRNRIAQGGSQTGLICYGLEQYDYFLDSNQITSAGTSVALGPGSANWTVVTYTSGNTGYEYTTP
jgi:hypothetical protein